MLRYLNSNNSNYNITWKNINKNSILYLYFFKFINIITPNNTLSTISPEVSIIIWNYMKLNLIK